MGIEMTNQQRRNYSHLPYVVKLSQDDSNGVDFTELGGNHERLSHIEGKRLEIVNIYILLKRLDATSN
jgi:hypothetical protein